MMVSFYCFLFFAIEHFSAIELPLYPLKDLEEEDGYSILFNKWIMGRASIERVIGSGESLLPLFFSIFAMPC